MTLRELAEKKRRVGSFMIRASEPLPERKESKPLSSTAGDSAPPGPGERLLGTENLADVIPMFPPRGPGVENEWERASLLPAGSLGMILDNTTRTAWLACSRPGMPPLLIQPFPILGRLTGEPLAPLGSSPCETLHGDAPSEPNASESQPRSA